MPQNVVLNQEGGNCVAVFEELTNRWAILYHEPLGIGGWSSIQLWGK